MRKRGTTQNEVFLGFVSVCLFSTMLLILGVQESLHFLAEILTMKVTCTYSSQCLGPHRFRCALRTIYLVNVYVTISPFF